MAELIDQKLHGQIQKYLPRGKLNGVFVTATYAQSLDARISSAPGVRTAISHPQTKAMTQFLRLHHDAILIGAGTAVADDPGLNCKYPGHRGEATSPVPVIVDRSGRWRVSAGAKIIKLAQSGEGKGPYIVTTVEGESHFSDSERELLQSVGGGVIIVEDVGWPTVLEALQKRLGVKSVMVEGGGYILQSLFEQSQLVDSVIVTIGSVYLGNRGVEVSTTGLVELGDVEWWTGIRDSVLLAKPEHVADNCGKD